MARQPIVGHGILIVEASRSQTHHTWWDSSGRVTSPTQRPLPDNTQHSKQTDIHASGRIRTLNPNNRTAEEPRFRPRGHWARPVTAFYSFWCNSPHCARASSFTRFVDHIQRHTAIGRTPLDERSTRLRDLYLISYNTQKRETSMPPVGFFFFV